MPESVEIDADRRAAIVKGRRNWALMFVPLFAVICAAVVSFGFVLIFPFLIGALVVALLYQRAVKGRSWRSIIWGAHVSSE